MGVLIKLVAIEHVSKTAEEYEEILQILCTDCNVNFYSKLLGSKYESVFFSLFRFKNFSNWNSGLRKVYKIEKLSIYLLRDLCLCIQSLLTGWKHKLLRHCNRCASRRHINPIPVYHLPTCLERLLIKWKITVSSWQRKEAEDTPHKLLPTRTTPMT